MFKKKKQKRESTRFYIFKIIKMLFEYPNVEVKTVITHEIN